MHWLLFLSRLALICGICILIWLLLAMIKTDSFETFTSTIIIIGYFIGGILLPLTNLSYLVVFLIRKKLTDWVPRWLVIANVAGLIILIYYIFYLNDPYYHQK
jgi:ABC-type microcin C transport system permease subunit YejB